MRLRTPLLLLLLSLGLRAQDPALKDTFLQAKSLWATQGDRDGATARFESVVAALAPKGAALEPEALQMLCEAYNWLAVLDDRSPKDKARAQVRFQALIDLNPDFDVDRTLTSQRLAGAFDRLKAERYASVKLTYLPEGGRLVVDGKPSAAVARKFLPFGSHTFAYSKAGHAPVEAKVDLAAKDAKALDLKLTRTSSTVTLYVKPSGAEVLLDGQSLGRAGGQAGPDAAPLAIAAGLRPEELSAPFVVPSLPPGRHRLELRAPCHKPKALALEENLATPMADHTLEPIQLAPSKGTLTVTSAWPGGELFLSGQSLGPLPVKEAPVCSGPYNLQVRFPGGGFSQDILVEEGKALSLEARPKPRLAFLGLEPGDFTGRARFQSLLEGFGARLQALAYLPPHPGETPAQALARLKASREAELVLAAAPVPGKVVSQAELRLATLDGEEERVLVKPLEQDPLGLLAERLNAVPPVLVPGLGLSLLDLPGEPGPWVLSASEAAQKAGVTPGKPLTQVQGTPVASRAAALKALAGVKGPVAVTQDAQPATLPLLQEALEIPLGDPRLSYPALLAQLRLQYAGAKGDVAGLLRLNQALALMQMRRFDRAIELLRDTRLSATSGVSQGTVDYHTGQCFLALGPAFLTEARQAFQQALKYPQATLLGPEGPLVAPLARQALDDLK